MAGDLRNFQCYGTFADDDKVSKSSSLDVAKAVSSGHRYLQVSRVEGR